MGQQDSMTLLDKVYRSKPATAGFPSIAVGSLARVRDLLEDPGVMQLREESTSGYQHS